MVNRRDGKAWINPILMKLGREFVRKHPKMAGWRPGVGKIDKGAPFRGEVVVALLIALNYRTNEEPLIQTHHEMINAMEIPPELALALNKFLHGETILLSKLGRQKYDFYGGDYDEVVSLATVVDDDNMVVGVGFDRVKYDGELSWEDYSWPAFTFDNQMSFYQSINYRKLKPFR